MSSFEPDNGSGSASFGDVGSTLLHIIDGDIIAYRCSAATDGRVYTVDSEEFKYLKEAKEYCDVHGFNHGKIVKSNRPEPLSHCLKLMKDILKTMPNREIYISDATNFRYKINPQYKANRKKIRRPAHLNDAKDYLVKMHGAKVVPDMEADDAIITRSTELDELGVEHLIASIDKDFLQKAGTHYDFIKKTVTVISEAEARKRLWLQICTGDSTDGIASPKGLGIKTAEKGLALVDWELTSDWLIFRGVLELYKQFMPQEPGEALEDYLMRVMLEIKMVASQIYLRRSIDDEWKIPQKDTTQEEEADTAGLSTDDSTS